MCVSSNQILFYLHQFLREISDSLNALCCSAAGQVMHSEAVTVFSNCQIEHFYQI